MQPEENNPSGDASDVDSPKVIPEVSAFDALLRSGSHEQDVPRVRSSARGAAPAGEIPEGGELRGASSDALNGSGSLNTSAAPFDFSDRPAQSTFKASALDWASLVFSVVLPPVGVALSVIARIISQRKTGWSSGVVRAATIVGVLMTLIAGGGLLAVQAITAQDEIAAARIVDSQPLCAELDETPGLLERPAFGWPVDVSALPATLEAMKAYHARWSGLADVAPKDQVASVRSVATAAQTLINAVETTKSIDRTRNLEQMSAIANQSGLAGWYRQYCK
ncbi:MAG: hypothetical protein ACOH1J_07140 [Microbacteriaceae bacterium]